MEDKIKQLLECIETEAPKGDSVEFVKALYDKMDSLEMFKIPNGKNIIPYSGDIGKYRAWLIVDNISKNSTQYGYI